MRYFEFDDHYALIAVEDGADAKERAMQTYSKYLGAVEEVVVVEVDRDYALVEYVIQTYDPEDLNQTTQELLNRFKEPMANDGLLLIDNSLLP